MRRGYLLLELLIGAGLVMTVASVVLAGFGRYQRRQTIVTATARIRQTLLEARSYAQAGRIDCATCGGADLICKDDPDDLTLNGWEVRLGSVAGNSLAAIGGYCGAAHFFEKIYDFPNTTLNFNPAAVDRVRFYSGDRGTSLNNAQWTITVTDGTTTGVIIVTRAGEIR